MQKSSIIFFTKEDGQNKFLCTTYGNDKAGSIDSMQIDNPFFEQLLGHKPTNLYAWVDGTEFRLPNKSHEEMKKIINKALNS